MPQKLKCEFPGHMAIPLFAFTPEAQKWCFKIYLHFYVHCSPTHNNQDLKTTPIPKNKLVAKETVVYKMKYYPVIKKIMS